MHQDIESILTVVFFNLPKAIMLLVFIASTLLAPLITFRDGGLLKIITYWYGVFL
jgi:hypothetical protein